MKIRNFQIVVAGAIFLVALPLHADSGHRGAHMKERGMQQMEAGHTHRGKSMMQAHVNSEGGVVKHVGEHQLKLLTDIDAGVLELHVMADEAELRKLNAKSIQAALKPKGKYDSKALVFSLIGADSKEKVFRASVDRLAENLPSELALKFPVSGTEHRAVFLIRPHIEKSQHMGR